jgi:SAM-dependent methyltransferase
MNVENLNRTFPKYPVTMQDKGWVYGVWYCPTAWMKTHFHGQFPLTFLKRIFALFPDAKDILHCPSGTLTFENNGVRNVTVDLIKDEKRNPQIIGSAEKLPFEDNSFDLYLSDPPYSDDDSKIYGCPPFKLRNAMAEARRVLRSGGYYALLHLRYPSFKRKDWNFVGLVGIVTGANRTVRLLSIFQKP